MAQKHHKIMGVNVTVTSERKVLDFIERRLKSGTKFFIATPNPEIVLKAQNDKALAKALNGAHISVPDGAGLFLDKKLRTLGERITGRELFESILQICHRNHYKVFLLGATPETNRLALKKIKKKFPGIIAKGTGDVEVDNEGQIVSYKHTSLHNDNDCNTSLITDINRFSPDMLVVAFGAPKQEKWVYSNLAKLNVSGAIVVGGALDYFSGAMALPPKWVGRSGLEWLWRLILEPARFKRIFNAVVVFPIMLVRYNLFTAR